MLHCVRVKVVFVTEGKQLGMLCDVLYLVARMLCGGGQGITTCTNSILRIRFNFYKQSLSQDHVNFYKESLL
jgi:hypothetical protein